MNEHKRANKHDGIFALLAFWEVQQFWIFTSIRYFNCHTFAENPQLFGFESFDCIVHRMAGVCDSYFSVVDFEIFSSDVINGNRVVSERGNPGKVLLTFYIVPSHSSFPRSFSTSSKAALPMIYAF